MAERTCTLPECDKPYRARGLCVTHYNHQHQPERHRKVTVACDYCGTACEKGPTGKYAKRFCSLFCRDLWRCDQPDDSMYQRTPRLCVIPSDHPARWCGKSEPVVYANCAECQALMCSLARSARVYCGPPCRRRARERRSTPVKAQRRIRNRAAIFERDAWVCWLCNQQTDPAATVPHPQAPTLDHLTPRAHGGGDEPDNLATAHFLCNSYRGDRLDVTSIVARSLVA